MQSVKLLIAKKPGGDPFEFPAPKCCRQENELQVVENIMKIGNQWRPEEGRERRGGGTAIWINISGHAGAFNVFILYFIMLISFAMIELNANDDGHAGRSDSLPPPHPAAATIQAHW